MALETELATFARLKRQLVNAHRGKYALIHGDDFLDAFDSPENAYNEGIKRFGRNPFLVKLIKEQEETFRNFALASGLMHACI